MELRQNQDNPVETVCRHGQELLNEVFISLAEGKELYLWPSPDSPLHEEV